MAFTAATQFDVRTTGDNSNGGGCDLSLGGTNFAKQDSPQVTYTDLVIDPTTNTKITSIAHPFDSTHVGNIINVTGGTGFTVQRVQVLSVALAVATCDKAVGTTSSTGGAGKLGGGVLTVGTANGLVVDGNTINIKTGTYTHTTATAIPVANMAWVGYNSAWGDGGTKPLITTSTNSVDLITTTSNGGTQRFENLSLSNTAGTRGNGIVQLSTHGTTQMWQFVRCLFDGFSNGINSDNVGAHFDLSNTFLTDTEIKNCTADGIVVNAGILIAEGCWIHANGGNAIIGNAGSAVVFTLVRCTLSGNTSSGVDLSGILVAIECSVSANGSKGFFPSSSAAYNIFLGNALFGNSGDDLHFSALPTNIARYLGASRNNAYGTSANWPGARGDVTLSASPFTSTTDFTPNGTAGGGPLLKGAGLNSSLFGAGGADIGAVQTASAGSSVAISPLGGIVR